MKTKCPGPMKVLDPGSCFSINEEEPFPFSTNGLLNKGGQLLLNGLRKDVNIYIGVVCGNVK